MKHGSRILVALALSLLATPVPAANKCIDGDGRISYQATPCPPTSRGGDMNLNVNRPVSGQVIPPETPQSTPSLTITPDRPRQGATDNSTQPPEDAEQE